jgi:hypothetical protein
VAIGLTFAASGLVHVVPVLAADVGHWREAGEMFGYFVYQLCAIAVETFLLRVPTIRALKERHGWLGPAWTIVHLFGPSYLLASPCMKLAGLEF